MTDAPSLPNKNPNRMPADAVTAYKAEMTDPGITRADLHVEDAVLMRRSIRAFKPDAVPKGLLRRLLEAARYAPSGANIQPWEVSVLTGKSLARYSEEMMAGFANDPSGHKMDYAYYAPDWREPFQARRYACGFGLYETRGIARGDREGRRDSFLENFRFFGAPSVLLFWIPKDLAMGAWLDYGMFIQNIALLAQGWGLASIAQGALGQHSDVARNITGMPKGHILLCGMSIGWPDLANKLNAYQPGREPVDGFTTWHD